MEEQMDSLEKRADTVASSSRRNFLSGAMAATAAGLAVQAGVRAGFAHPPAVSAQSLQTPDAAIQELMAGNGRFVSGRITSNELDVEILKQHNAEKQEPFAAVLSCADSRVPVEIVFDQTIGHLFVTRVAGNVITPEIIGSLEYGAVVLGTKAIVVMGHGNCGAVKATIQGKPVPGQISALFPHIQPAVDQAGHDLEAATRANAKIQATLLRESSPVLSELVKAGKLKVVPAYYAITSGKVTLL
jgi:carbonic anhydrase